MKYIFRSILTVLIVHNFIIGTAFAIDLVKSDTSKNTPITAKDSPKSQFIGWLDQNKDGINDKFQDANGDGINDVTKEKYEHHFKFADKNKDGVNDIFVDKDGDGVNDLGTKFIDKNKDSINDNVLDFNKDGINDITGLKYKKDNLMGYRYGIVEEEAKIKHKKFIDENGDGMHDPISKRMCFQDENADGINDRFVDNDGDGICDGRRFGYRRNRMGMMDDENKEKQSGKSSQNGRRWRGGR
jgi:hypothetical protein